METTVNFIADVVDEPEQKMILDHVNSVVKTIKD
jgi:hypothetical protein